MKKIFSLIVGILVAVSAICQTPIKGIVEPSRPFVEGMTGAVWNQKIRVEARDNTVYTWTLEVPNDSVRHFVPMDGKKYKAVITFMEIKDAPVIDVATVDNSSFTFSPSVNTNTNTINAGGWSQFDYDVAPNPAWCKDFYMGSCSFSNLTNATITYNFSGNRIEVWGEKGANKGKTGFKIDNITEQIVDMYTAGSNNNYQLLWSADFTQGQHTITIRVTGQKNNSASDAHTLVDMLKVFSQR